MEIFRGRLRRVGNSLSVLIPKKTLDLLKLQEGDDVDVALMPTAGERQRRLAAAIGSVPGLQPFKRDRKDRY